MKLTDEQKQAIDSVKKNVVVSASAGSGKTGTMVLRVINLIKRGVPADRIVMLTYTENAAHEMMSRLADALFEEIRVATGEEKARLIEAHDRLPMLSCGTIHSFCYKLIMAHFEQLGLSPLYTIVESNAADALKARVFNNVVRSRHEKGGQAFLDFLGQFDVTGDEELRESVKQVYDCMTSLEEREGCLTEWENIADSEAEDIPAVAYYLDSLKRRFDALMERYNGLYQEASDVGAKDIAAQILYRIDTLTTTYAFDTLRDLCLCVEPHEFSSTPSIGKKEKEAFADLYARYTALEKARVSFEEVKLFVAKLGGYDGARETYRHSARFIKELLAFVREFDAEYRKVKEDKKLLDFADLEQYALQLLEREEIRKEVACDHVLVDEKQDVNPIQDRLVRLLSEGHSLFSVGDVKQSIFRFRQGAPEIFQGLMKEGRADPDNSEVILFDKNFRSSKAVISFVNEVFMPLMTEEFGGVAYAEAPLRGRENAEDGTPIPDVGYVDCRLIPVEAVREKQPPVDKIFDLREADRAVKEADAAVDPEAEWVRDRILEVVGTKQYDAKKGKFFTVGYGDIAILAAKRGPLSSKVISCLRDAHIPISLGAFKKDGKEQEAAELTDFMRLVLSPHDDYAFVSALRSPMFEFDVEELARISLAEGDTYYDKAKAYAESAEGGKMREFLAYLDKVRFDSSVLPIADLLSRVVEERFRLSLLREADGRLRFGSLRAFVREVRAKRITSVAGFIDYFDNEYQGTNGEIADGNAVTFMTVHGSKGLEFPVVFVIDTGRTIVSQQLFRGSVTVDKEFGVHKRVVESEGVQRENLTFKAVLEKKKREIVEDSLRLMYVALTRAKNVLYVSGKIRSNRLGAVLAPENAQTMAEWIDYVMPARPHGRPTTEVSEKEDVKIAEEGSVFIEESDAASAQDAFADPKEGLRKAFAFEYAHKAATTTGIKYTVTGINNMDDEGYYPPKPLFKEDKTERGTVLHALMEEIPLTVTELSEVTECLERLVRQGTVTAEEAQGVDAALVSDAAKKIRALTGERKVMREKTFMLQVPAADIGIREVEDDVVVQGKVDLLALGNNDAVIVDYKASSAPDAVLRERYREQLALYALAVKKALGIENVRTYIFVLGRNRLVEIRP